MNSDRNLVQREQTRKQFSNYESEEKSIQEQLYKVQKTLCHNLSRRTLKQSIDEAMAV